MEPAGLVAQAALAGVFLVAALAKLGDRAGSRAALTGFGVPGVLAGPLGVLLSLAELAVAAALLLVPEPGALASLALLLAFSAAIVVNLLRGHAPDCHCFGSLHSAPVSWWTVARNLLLALVAAGLVWSAPSWVLLGGLAGALAVTLAERRRARRSVVGLAMGAEAPAFSLPALDGSTVSLESLVERGRPVLLVFSDPGCGPCSLLAPRLAEWQRDLRGQLSVWVVARGDLEENRAKAAEHGLRDLVLDADEAVADAYRTQGTPSAVLVGADGRVASPVAVAAYGIETLVAELTGAPPLPPPRPAAKPGKEAGLTRLELLVRAGSAAAGVAGFALFGARDAAAGAIPIFLKCKYVRCGNRCCPKTAICGTRRGKKVCICPDGRETCGNKCCKETFVCRKNARGKKVCVCPPRTRLCQGRCVPLTDPAHCGRCGVECPPATVCVDGVCVGGDGSGTAPGGLPPCDCPPGETCCDGACTDLNTNAAHCGRCDQACPPGQQCCDGVCKDLELDPQNCGECGKRCPAGQVCADGRCGGNCPSGLTNCDGRCVDLAADNENCRECGRRCAEGLTCCGEADCVDTRIRPDHCTACFTECNPFLCNCWDNRCGGPPEYGCWGDRPPPPAGSRRRVTQRAGLARLSRDRGAAEGRGHRTAE
jgi:peroxiredoxin